MRLGSPRSATSALLDSDMCVFIPAMGRGTICELLKAYTSGRRWGSGTGTESGKLSVSHRKYLEAHGRVGCELGRGRTGTALG
jgi:hypothetical protein